MTFKPDVVNRNRFNPPIKIDSTLADYFCCHIWLPQNLVQNMIAHTLITLKLKFLTWSSSLREQNMTV